jgi:hypothetical protein
MMLLNTLKLPVAVHIGPGADVMSPPPFFVSLPRSVMRKRLSAIHVCILSLKVRWDLRRYHQAKRRLKSCRSPGRLVTLLMRAL